MNATLKLSFNTKFDRTTQKKPNIFVIVACVAFLFFNSVKLSLFNIFLLQNQTKEILEYKFFITLLTVFIMYALMYKVKSRAFHIAFYILQTIYILVNIAYFMYFHSYLHILQGIWLFGESVSVASTAPIQLNPKMLIVFIDLPFFIIMLTKGFYIDFHWRKLKKVLNIVVLSSLCILLSMEMFNFKQNRSIYSLMYNSELGETPIVERYGTITNNIVNLCFNISEKELISQLKYGKAIANEEKPAETSSDQTVKPNYILIQVESMDANIVNQQYKGNYVTPFLQSLTNSSIYYPYMMSFHEGGGTSDSGFSIMNSVEPLMSYPALKLSNYNYPNSLISKMDSGSYSTFAFHGNVGSYYNRDIAFSKLGFNEFDDMLKMNVPENGWGIPDNEVFDYSIKRLETVKQPFLSYIITMTSHEPFDSSRGYYNNALYDDIQDKTVKNYYNSMSYVDDSLKDLVDEIRNNFKNTYVLIYGDHTPSINTDLYKQASFTMDNRYFEFVPMFIITPDNQVRRETSKVGSFLDLSPTVLETSGITFDLKSNGQNLTAPSINNDLLPFKGGNYSRDLLFNMASATPVGK